MLTARDALAYYLDTSVGADVHDICSLGNGETMRPRPISDETLQEYCDSVDAQLRGAVDAVELERFATEVQRLFQWMIPLGVSRTSRSEPSTSHDR